MLLACIFLNANFFHFPMKKKMAFATQDLLWKMKSFHLFTKKEEQEHLGKLLFLVSLSSCQVVTALASVYQGWKQMDVPQISLGNQIPECFNWKESKMIPGPTFCFYS